MLYAEYIKKAKELTITFNEESLVSYLEPDWQTILYDNGMDNLEDIPDSRIDGWYDLEDVLKLEVEKRNAISSKRNLVYNWLYELISSTVDPAMMQEETDLIQSMIEFSRMKNAENTSTESNEEPK